MNDISKNILKLSCVECQRDYSRQPFRYTCECGGNLDYIFDYEYINSIWSKNSLLADRQDSIWRYLPLLPVKNEPPDTGIKVGRTPFIEFSKLAEELSIGNLWVKDDTRNPSGSLKDRASEIAICHAKELGAGIVIAASTGNAAASLSCLGACHHMKILILAPASAPKAKLTQILQYGADLLPVKSNYDDAFDLSFELSRRYALYSRNTGVNPVLSEGKKTVALEIAEQMNWQMPDMVFVPVGDGCIIGAVYKGFYDLFKLNWIDRIPRLIAVQSETSSAIVNALKKNEKIQPVESRTIADSISVNYPRDGMKALRAIKKSDGFGILVSDEEILQAQHKLASSTGIFCEPASAAAFAGLTKSVDEKRVTKHDRVVVLATGTGLKDIDAASKIIRVPSAIQPDVDKVDQRLRELLRL